MTPLVSVILPVSNDRAGIDAGLAALAARSWPRDRCEVIVIDNASKPPIRLNPTVADFARIVVCPTPSAYAARNAGIAAARGEVLAFTDADCIPDRNWIRAAVAALASGERCCIVGGEVVFRGHNDPLPSSAISI